MEDDYSTTSHYLTYKFLLKKLGECSFCALNITFTYHWGAPPMPNPRTPKATINHVYVVEQDPKIPPSNTTTLQNITPWNEGCQPVSTEILFCRTLSSLGGQYGLLFLPPNLSSRFSIVFFFHDVCDASEGLHNILEVWHTIFCQ